MCRSQFEEFDERAERAPPGIGRIPSFTGRLDRLTIVDQFGRFVGRWLLERGVFVERRIVVFDRRGLDRPNADDGPQRILVASARGADERSMLLVAVVPGRR
jgi:hypothetical protein